MAEKRLSVRLRDYQEECLRAIQDAEYRGVRRQVVAIPCGTGKTVIAADLIRRRAGRALFLVHRDELVGQTIEKLGVVAPASGPAA